MLDEGEQIAAALGLVLLLKRISAFRERYRLRLARNPAGLTTREFEVLQLLASGKANKDIAEALFISTHTVAVHVARVLEKTGSSNRTAAVAYPLATTCSIDARGQPMNDGEKKYQFC